MVDDNKPETQEAPPEPHLTAQEIADAWRKGQISRKLAEAMLRAEGYEVPDR